MQHLFPQQRFTRVRKPKQGGQTMIRTTLATIALIAAAGVAHAQMQAPSTPEGRDQPSMPGATSNPIPPAQDPMQSVGGRSAAKAAWKQGYTGVKSLTATRPATGRPRR
jgi:hypothetical protein